MLGRTDSRGRLLFLLVAFVVGATALVGRLAWWQIVRSDDLSAEARRQSSVRTEEPSARGSIYDRSGTVVLATTVERDRVAVAADQLTPEERRAVSTTLAGILGLDDVARRELDERLRSARPYVIVARDVPPETSARIRAAARAGELVHVRLEPEPVRTYPQAGGGPDTTLASHLIGFVNREGVGQYGVEQQYQELLAGQPRILLAQRDVNARAIPETAVVAEPGVPGADLRLTIDAGLQLAVEQELLAAWIADHAVSASAIVMDPYTGEIYAHASYPAYDANDYRAIAGEDPSRFVDPLVSEVYEPGSVFKMFTALAALEQGTVKTSTRIRDVGTLKLDKGRTKIDNADRKGKGWMSFEDAIAWSRNVVAAKVALGLAKDTRSASAILHEVWTRMGFGLPTGIDLAGEVNGIVRDPTITTWREIDLANGSFGQGVAVTPIQLATAYAAMINGGQLVEPHVVLGIGDEDVAPTSKGQVIDPELSKTLVGMMNHVVTEVPFYADRTLIPGYFVGGKTGTAQIWDAKRGQWKHNLFNYSFVGYVGREEGKPELVVAVRIHEAKPTIAEVGQLEMPVMSFALFRRIATAAITTPGLLPDQPRDPLPAAATPGPVAADR
jgi:cell division protein FtsI/penicillin-binding protein 2